MRLIEFHPRQLRHFDFALFGLLVCLALFGVAVIWGSSGQTALTISAKKQFIFMLIGLAALTISALADLKTVEWLGYPLYGLCVALLIFVLFRGVTVSWSKSWFDLGLFKLQPSELAKGATVLVLASHISRNKLEKLSSLLVAGVIVGLPMALTLKQNDTGTALVFVPIFLSMVYMGGIRKRVLGIMFGLVALGVVIGLPQMKDYHLARISEPLGKRLSTPLLVMLDKDPEKIWALAQEKAAWHSEQAKIAIGSGRLSGKGWSEGTQTRWDWLPTYETDFIFASLGEQFGFLGCVGLILAFSFLLYKGGRIALDARDMFSSLLVVGLMAIFVSHLLVNLGMVLDLIPIIGLPLPFVSYGGSFLVTTFALFGLILNVGMRKYLY